MIINNKLFLLLFIMFTIFNSFTLVLIPRSHSSYSLVHTQSFISLLLSPLYSASQSFTLIHSVVHPPYPSFILTLTWCWWSSCRGTGVWWSGSWRATPGACPYPSPDLRNRAQKANTEPLEPDCSCKTHSIAFRTWQSSDFISLSHTTVIRTDYISHSTVHTHLSPLVDVCFNHVMYYSTEIRSVIGLKAGRCLCADLNSLTLH